MKAFARFSTFRHKEPIKFVDSRFLLYQDKNFGLRNRLFALASQTGMSSFCIGLYYRFPTLPNPYVFLHLAAVWGFANGFYWSLFQDKQYLGRVHLLKDGKTLELEYSAVLSKPIKVQIADLSDLCGERESKLKETTWRVFTDKVGNEYKLVRDVKFAENDVLLRVIDGEEVEVEAEKEETERKDSNS